MRSTSPDPGRPPDSKAVLFCFDCGHESSIDGDWAVERRDDCELYRCPECGTTISVRPDQSGDADSEADSGSDSRVLDADGGRQSCLSD